MEDVYLSDGDPYTDTYFMELIKARLQSKYCEIWAGDVNTLSKLELYKTIKPSIGVEHYVKAFYLTTQQRRYIAMCRGGILLFEIEKGRWSNKPRKQRICKQCDNGEVEDIYHFILHCTCNRNLRATYLPPNESLH